jgi:AcrR family transcriptional regulator
MAGESASALPERLLAVATRLFAEKGFEATSVQEIVESAGVTKGAMYHYFASKDDLLFEIYHRLLMMQTRRLEQFAEGVGTAGERLRAAAVDVLDTSFLHLDELTVFFRSMHLLTQEKRKSVRAERRRYHERFRALVEEGQTAGIFRGDVPADIVVLGLGVDPNAQLAADAGLRIGARGAIGVDRRQQTSVDGIWSAGDCCESYHLVSDTHVHIPLGTIANKQARVAGANIGGGYATFPGVVGTAVSKICDTEVARSGLTEADAASAGFQYLTVTIESTTRAGYYPGSAPITVKMLAERRSGRLLGAQLVGQEGAAKRIDVVAVALHTRMTVEQMTHLDLSYAPPFGPVWDPVLIAARKLASIVAEE